MSIWGLSQSGKNSRGDSREIDRWLFDTGRQARGRADQQYETGEGIQNELLNRWRQQLGGGFGSTQSTNERGNEIMPWLDPMIQARNQRTLETIGQRGGFLDEMGRNIGGTYGQNEADIINGTSRMAGRGMDFSNDIIGNMQGVYGSARQNSGNLFGSLGEEAGSTYDAAINSVAPGSEARAAAASRAFAPEVSRVHQQLRAAGIDSRSPEGMYLLSNVRGQRARSMDDRLADAIGQEAGLRIDKFNTRSALGREGMYNDQGLALAGLRDVSDEKLRAHLEQQGLDANMIDSIIANRTQQHGENQGLLGRRMDESSMNRQAMNDDDLLAHELRMGRYGAGVDSQLRDQESDRYREGQMGNLMGGAFGQSNTQSGIYSQNMGQAKQGFENTLGQEERNSGWLKKILGGVATGALNTIFPGSGGIVGGIMGGFGNQKQGEAYIKPNPYTSQAQSGGNWLQPGFNPFSVTETQRASTPAPYTRPNPYRATQPAGNPWATPGYQPFGGPGFQANQQQKGQERQKSNQYWN